MQKDISVRSVPFGKDNFSVTVYANVDHAFIVALIVILEAMNHVSDLDRLGINTGLTQASLPTVQLMQ